MQFRSPNERERAWLMVIPVVALYLGLQNVIKEERAFLTSLSVYTFYVIISVEWRRRYDGRFWLLLSVFAIIHVIAIAFIRFPHFDGPSIAVALPFMFLDGFAMWGVLNWRLR